MQTQLRLDVPLDASLLSLPEGADAAAREQAIDAADWGAPLREALLRLFPGGDGAQPGARARGAGLDAARARSFATRVARDPALLGGSLTLWLPADDEVDLVVKGIVPRDPAVASQRLSADQLGWLAALETDGRVRRTLNGTFLTRGRLARARAGGRPGSRWSARCSR